MPGRSTTEHQRLPATPASAGVARRLVRTTASDALDGELVDVAVLLVSELVTNAVVHAGTPIELTVSLSDASALTVEVGDGSPHQPVTRSYGTNASTGRGLRMVEDLADDWGISVDEAGKTVWFRVSGDHPGQPGPAQHHGHGAAPRADTVLVELLDVPLVLHARWQEHAEALLREYLLVRLDEGPAEREVLRHAECSDAVALLGEAVPPPTDDACERGADEELPRATVAVPRTSVPHFATLDRTLDLAIALADSDGMLSLATPPRARAFRRWVCRQVAAQAAGAPPVPWRAR